jgi:RNA polymerase sigma-70 factor (ECF subfamily)
VARLLATGAAFFSPLSANWLPAGLWFEVRLYDEACGVKGSEAAGQGPRARRGARLRKEAVRAMAAESLPRDLAGIRRAQRVQVSLQDQVARLYEETREDVYRYLLTLGLHPPQAQEAVQEVFLRFYVTLRKGEKIESPRGWLFRVAHNLGLKTRTKQDAHPPFDPELEGRLAGKELDPEEGLIDRERMRRFHRAVEALSPQQKRCLFLRLEGLRYPEIGAALGISASTAGEFLRRAITRLRKATHA